MAKSRRRSATRRPLRRPASSPTEFNPDYTYIKQDLRRIAVLAVSFIVVLVALSFVIH
jgi:hypothetical protein